MSGNQNKYEDIKTPHPTPAPSRCVPDHPHPTKKKCGGGQETGVGVGWGKNII